MEIRCYFIIGMKKRKAGERMKSKKILLKNANIITEMGEVLLGQDIVIEEGKITSVLPAREYGAEEAAFDRSVDCSSYYVTPGLTNLHCHCGMNIFKGIAEDVDSDGWFNKKIFPYESKLEAEDVYVGTKLGVAEMLNCGITAFADHYFEEKAVLKAVMELGIRADIAPTVFGTAPNFEQRLDEVSDFCEKNRNISSRVAVRMGPHAPYTCPPPTLKRIVDRAKELKLGIHLHVSETREQLAASKEIYGRTPYDMLAEAGGFDQQVLVAHGLWMEQEDVKYLGENTWLAFCPKTYEKLAMGTGLAFKNRRNFPYSFGTDGAASSNSLNTCEQARYFGLLGKFETWDACDYETMEVWQALMRGHEAFSFNSGRIAPGYAADLVIWDLKKPNTWPVYHPVTTILYSSEPSNVLYTMVEGEFLKENGKLVLDEAALLDEGAAVQKKILERGQGEAKVYY